MGPSHRRRRPPSATPARALAAGLLVLAVLRAAPALADCTSPAGVAGTVTYASGQMQYCSGSAWASMKIQSAGTCAGAGRTQFSGTDLTFCDGSTAWSMKGPVLGTCTVNGLTAWNGTVPTLCIGTTLYSMSLPAPVTVTASGTGVNVSPGSATVAYLATTSFTVTAQAGYALSSSVGGTCPQGSWTGSTWTTGRITAACSVTFTATSALPRDSALIAYYPLDDAGPSIADQSGNGNNGTSTGAYRTTGKQGYGYQFSNNTCITIPNSTSLQMNGYNTYTMMAWVNYSGGCGSDRGEILNKENQYEMGPNCSSGNFDEATWSTTSTWFWTSYGYISTGTWHHVAITWDGGTLRAYQDGALTGSRALGGTFFSTSTGMGIGCRSVPASGAYSGVGSFFIGTIDEVAVYRRALSASEISTYYTATR